MKDLKRMPDKKELKQKRKILPKLSQKERFLEYAKEIGVEDDDVERSLDKIIKGKKPK